MSWHTEIAKPRYYVGMRYIDSQKRKFEIVETWWDDGSDANFYVSWTTPEGHRINIQGDERAAELKDVSILEIGKDRSEILRRSVQKMETFEQQKLITFY